ncbi:MAG: iron-containing alcohol dehydrogenase [SAR324 cluster bacterium]|nr:iron-containing alcohol dehydrogenase [SAR324 cluster bacterium]
MSVVPFKLQVNGYQNYQKVLKEVAKNLPFPAPTLFSGPGSSLELCKAIAYMGTKKLLIVTDAMLIKIGLLDNIKKALEQHKVEYVIYDGVLPDPTFAQVEAGLTVLKKNKCDAVLAVGGGSSMDAGKLICARATNDKPLPKFAGLFKVFKTILPLFVIPTTAGTGSEVTIAAVVSDPVAHQKIPVMDPKLIPTMAALDGALMTGLPPMITAATGMDALTHAVEAYISANAMPSTDSYALAATRLIMENLTNAVKNGQDVETRQNMAQASYYAGLAFTRAGVGYVHAIAHNFGAYYHTPHGLANSIVLPHVLDYSKETSMPRLAHLAVISGLQKGKESDQKLADKFIAHIRAMMKDYNIPEKLEALKKEDIPAIAKAALKEAHFTYAVPKYMDQATCEKLISKMMV